MSFPIYGADLNDVASPKLNLSSVELPEGSTFVEKRVLTLSKQITAAAVNGEKECKVNIVMPTNVEPVSAVLKVNFPDATITVDNTVDGHRAPSTPGPRGGRNTTVVVNWA